MVFDTAADSAAFIVVFVVAFSIDYLTHLPTYTFRRFLTGSVSLDFTSSYASHFIIFIIIIIISSLFIIPLLFHSGLKTFFFHKSCPQ